MAIPFELYHNVSYRRLLVLERFGRNSRSDQFPRPTVLPYVLQSGPSSKDLTNCDAHVFGGLYEACVFYVCIEVT